MEVSTMMSTQLTYALRHLTPDGGRDGVEHYRGAGVSERDEPDAELGCAGADHQTFGGGESLSLCRTRLVFIPPVQRNTVPYDVLHTTDT